MIQKDAFNEWMEGQLGVLQKEWLTGETKDSWKSKIVHVARLEDIAFRMVNQIVANVCQGMIQPPKVWTDDQGQPLGGYFNSPASHKSRSSAKHQIRNIVQGLGSNGSKPILMGDLGCLGVEHALSMGCSRLPFIKMNSVKLELFQTIFSSQFLGKDVEFSNALVANEQTEFFELKELYADELDSWDIFTQETSPEGIKVKGDTIEEDFITQGFTYVVGGSFDIGNGTFRGVVDWLQEADLSDVFYDGSLGFFFPDSAENKHRTEWIYSSELANYTPPDLSGEKQEEMALEMSNALIQDMPLGVKNTGSTVISPGKISVPRVSPMTPTRVGPATIPNPGRLGLPSSPGATAFVVIGNIMQQLPQRVIDETAILEAIADHAPEAQSAVMRSKIQERRTLSINCAVLTEAVKDAFLVKFNIADEIKAIAFETDDNEPRKSVKKQSRKN